MYIFRRKINPVRMLVFIMIGAVLIVFTDIFILDEGKQVFPEGLPEFSSLFEHDKNETDLKVSSLRAQHRQYLQNGIAFSDQPDVPLAFPTQIVKEKYANSADQKGAVLNKIAPAVGIEGDVEPEKQQSATPSENFEGMGDLYGAIYDERTFDDKPPQKKSIDVITNEIIQKDLPETFVHPEMPLPKMQNRYVYKKPIGGGRIAIIIDDMGLNLRSRLVEVLPGPLTLAYLPYAKNLPAQTARAGAQGHELMVHMPMEAMNATLDGGPNVLKVSQSQTDLKSTLNWGLSQFDGYVGVNNHMGSRLTSNSAAMQTVMDALKKRDLFFIDSRTIGSTVAADVARKNGLAYAERDIFLDHEITPDFIRGALQKLENTARSQGYAIAIGHPHQETINALKEWLPTLSQKGLRLVPASAVLHVPVEKNDAVASN